MIYQLMFAIITPALITGAFAERMKFSAMTLFMVLWSLIVYAPMAHMVWGKGGFLNAALGGRFPTLDFAGGTVVHVTSGVSALVCALYLGRRIGYPKQNMPPHSVVLSFIGACLLWVGWFGFNAGSALSAGSLATSAFVATHFGAASAALGWSAAEWLRNGKPSALGAISGAVAGLVAITPAAGFVSPMSAIVIGLLAGVGCYFQRRESHLQGCSGPHTRIGIAGGQRPSIDQPVSWRSNCLGPGHRGDRSDPEGRRSYNRAASKGRR
jgi:Amt family ammonium transporter